MIQRPLIFFWIGLVLNLFFIAAHGAENASSLGQIMAIADIHFNPFADCTLTTKPCPEALELNKAKASEWPSILSKYNSQNLPSYGEETNYKLFTSLLSQIKQQHPENIVILGDFLVHHFQTKYVLYVKDLNKKDYQQFVLNTLQYITQSIQEVSPANSSIFPVIGNNDSFGGKDCTSPDYCSIANGDFFKTLTQIWAPLIKDKTNRKQFTSTFPIAGYYAITLPNNNHLLVLNTVLYSNHAEGYQVAAAAHTQTVWFKKQLALYQKAHQKTWIAWHIPPGIDAYSTASNLFHKIKPFWNENDNQEVLNIINQYMDTIAGVYSGHLHMDGFLLLGVAENKQPLIDSFVPAISPLFGNNAAYKIYDYDGKNLNWCNYTTYYLSLIHSSISEDWEKEYIFNTSFQNNLKDCRLISGFSKISLNVNNPFTANYLTFYNVSSHFKSIPKEAWKPFWCTIHNLNIADYQNCLVSDSH